MSTGARLFEPALQDCYVMLLFLKSFFVSNDFGTLDHRSVLIRPILFFLTHPLKLLCEMIRSLLKRAPLRSIFQDRLASYGELVLQLIAPSLRASLGNSHMTEGDFVRFFAVLQYLLQLVVVMYL